MLLNELIERLQDIYKKYGDLPVNIIVENDDHTLQIEREVGSTAVSIQYRKNGEEVEIPKKVIIIQEDFE